MLAPQTAHKIAAGEVIDCPASVVRELMDNALDSGSSRIRVDVDGGGIERVRVSDNGWGMSRADLDVCASAHATSKITSEDDLLTLATLGFRGEALASMAAVARLVIITGGYKLTVQGGARQISECALTGGLVAEVTGLFDAFPARRRFLKRAFAEARQCKSVFCDKVLPCPDVEFSLYIDGEEQLVLPRAKSLTERFVDAMGFYTDEKLFFQIDRRDERSGFAFSLVIGEPAVFRTSRKDIRIFVNDRRVSEYSLVQAIVYGTQGYFPNGSFPVASLYVTMRSDLVDFNIHPAKKEVRFKDVTALHRAVSSSVHEYFKEHTRQLLSEQIDSSAFTAPLQYDRPAPLQQTAATQSGRHSRFEADPIRASALRAVPPNLGEPRIASPRYEEASYVPADGDDQEVRYVGWVLGTFLLAERADVLYIIDQHAAHERMLYDQLVARAGERQELLIPIVIETDSDAEDEAIRSLLGRLDEAGFRCEQTAAGRWEVRSVPLLWHGGAQDLRAALLDRRVDPGSVVNCVAASIACRRAVMDGTALSVEEAERIACGALSLSDPHCPHGRPVYTTITRANLFSLVRRT